MAKIHCIGEEWRGSNASGFFYALSRLGHIIAISNELSHISVRAKTVKTKFLNRMVRSFQIRDFNEQVINQVKSFQPDLIVVYKGAFLKAETIHILKARGIPIINFFPDVSFLAHGQQIPQCVPLYDHIFTTKTFGAADLHKNFGIPTSRISFIPHGFDPLIHRPLHINNTSFACEASFIGNYSAHKSRYLIALKEKITALDLKIWGGTWGKERNMILEKSIQSLSIEGDLYALALNSSLVNIALLSEQVAGASRGDQITSRTFHIPAARGFMLHQRTEEVMNYFKENEEMACFDSEDELSDKVSYYLRNPEERERIRLKGYQRALKDHSMDQRAQSVLHILNEKGIVK